MTKKNKPSPRVTELLLQALTHERGGVVVYRTALDCAIHPDLRAEWQHFFEETQSHVEILTTVCDAMGIDPLTVTPGCKVVQQVGVALVVAMQMAIAAEDRAAAQLVACECVVLAETKDHANWELLGEVAKSLHGEAARVLGDAVKVVEDQEDEHLYHTKGWCRELWLDALGLESVLPPPEEKRDVRSAFQQAKVEQARKKHEKG